MHPRSFALALSLGAALAAVVSSCGGPDPSSESSPPAAPLSADDLAAPEPIEPTVSYADLGYANGILTLDGEPFTGIASESYPDGTPKTRIPLRNGLSHGVVKEWYEDGTPKTEAHFIAGKRHGPNTYWHPDGSIMKKQLWQHGKLVSDEKGP